MDQYVSLYNESYQKRYASPFVPNALKNSRSHFVAEFVYGLKYFSISSLMSLYVAYFSTQHLYKIFHPKVEKYFICLAFVRNF